MRQDRKDRLAKVQQDWVTGIAELRQARTDEVMEALADGDTKYAIAQAMGVRGPTVDSIVKTATQAPKQQQAER